MLRDPAPGGVPGGRPGPAGPAAGSQQGMEKGTCSWGPPALGPRSATHTTQAHTSEKFTASAGELLICSQLCSPSPRPTCS